MIRGTNAQFKFVLPYKYDEVEKLRIVFWQTDNNGPSRDRSLPIVKTLEYCRQTDQPNEISVTLSQIVQKASQLIKGKGKFYIVIPAERMCETIKLFGKFGFEAKRMEMYEHNGAATVCVFEAVKNASSGIKIKILKESL